MPRKLAVEITANTQKLQAALKGTQSNMQKLGRTAGIAGAALGGALLLGARAGFKELSEAAKVGAQTQAVIESTGGAANVTAKQVDALAESLMRKSGVDDEAIASGENMLMTFTNIRNELGKGNDIFNQATEASLDFAVAMGKEVPDAALMVGKALNMPTKGVTKLEKAGVQFTDSQKAMIKKLEESGDVIGAQKIILKELEKQFGGSAAAAGKTLPGQLNIAKESFSNLAGELMQALLPALTQIAEWLTRLAGFLREHPTLLKVAVVGVAALATALLAASAASMLLNLSLLANPIGLTVLAVIALVAGLAILYKKFETVRTIVDFLRDHWKLLLFAFGLLPGIIMLIVTHFGTLKAKAMPVINAIKGAFDKVRTAAASVKDFIVGTLWPKVEPILKKIRGAANDVRDAFGAIVGKVQNLVSWIQTLIGWIGKIPSLPGTGSGIGGWPERGGPPSGATGGHIARGGLMRVHTGEDLVPARIVNRGAQGYGGSGQFALIWAGPDFFAWEADQRRRRRMKGHNV